MKRRKRRDTKGRYCPASATRGGATCDCQKNAEKSGAPSVPSAWSASVACLIAVGSDENDLMPDWGQLSLNVTERHRIADLSPRAAGSGQQVENERQS